jgi:Zn-dependent oligopeptidases
MKTMKLNEIEKNGEKFRETVLSLGGSEHPQTIYKKFRGRKAEVNSLLWLSGLGEDLHTSK